ncbi:ATP-binding protein [Bacteroidota bacterium]
MKDAHKTKEQLLVELQELRTLNKNTEEKIQQQNNFLYTILDSLTHPFYVIDVQDYTITIANSATGLEFPLKKVSCHSVTHGRNEPCASENHPCPLEIVKKTKKPTKVEHIHFDEQGNAKNVEVHGFPILNEKGNVVQMIEYSLDITDRKRAEQIRKVLYNISNAVINTSNLEKLIILIKDELGTIIDTTNFYVALYDEKTDTLSLPFHKDQKDKFTSFPAGKSLTAYVIKTKKPLLATKKVKYELEMSGEIELIGTDSEVWLGVPLIVKEKVTGAFALQNYDDENAYNKTDMEILEFISHQISISLERKITELEVKSALKKAKESDRLKTTFINTMSHELRTPLNAIIGFSELISGDEPIEEILDYVSVIHERGIHLINIVEGIFDVTLIESGQIKINKEKLFLNTVMQSVFNILKAEQINLQKQEIDIINNINDKNDRLSINTDESKLIQVLINLLKNALKFTKKGQIEYGYIKEIIDNKAFLKFYVKDTGIGIPKEMQKAIFNIFRQVDESSTRKYGGAGIGLSVAKKLTELLGGKIWLESEEGKGSSFYFTIPYHEPPEETKKIDKTQLKHQKELRFSTQTLLVVEDDDTNYNLIKIILEKQNFKVIRAINGKEAIEYCASNQNIQLVLMDIKLPGLNGYEATRQIKKTRPNLPIIAQTAHALYRSKEKSLEAGCDDYLSKPIIKDELFALLKKHLS